jgi:hypothetical protein
MLLVGTVVDLFRGAVAAEEVWQVLGECRTRHHRIATRFEGFQLQITLDMADEADDRGPFFQLGAKFWDQREGLCIEVV